MGKKLKHPAEVLIAEYYDEPDHPLEKVVEALGWVVLSS